MIKVSNALSLAALLGVFVVGTPAFAAGTAQKEPAKPTASSEPTTKDMKVEEKRQKIDAMAREALDKLLKESPKAKELYGKAYGYAVFDNLKLGLLFSGSGGKGVAVKMETKKRTYMSMGSAGVGLTVGGQKYQVVFLFADSTTFNNFVEKGWAATGAASAVAGEVGAGTTSNFVNGIAYYQMNTHGVMATADIAGTKYWKDKDLD